MHVRTITRYVRCREHLATIKGIGPDSVTVSTHLLQQTIYCLLCYVTQKPFLCFPPCVVCKELVCTDDSPIARFSQGIIRPRPSECRSVLLQKLKLEVEEMKQRKKMKVAANYRRFQIFPEEGNALNSKCKNNFLGIQINSAGHHWHHLKFTSLNIIKHHKCSLTEVIYLTLFIAQHCDDGYSQYWYHYFCIWCLNYILLLIFLNQYYEFRTFTCNRAFYFI